MRSGSLFITVQRPGLIVFLFCFLFFAPAMAAEIDLHITLWDLIKLSMPQRDKRTALEKAIDLPEGTTQELDRKLAAIDKLLTAKNKRPDTAVLSLALARASGDSSAAVLRRLLDAGADVNARDTVGLTAIMHACVNLHPGVIRLLIDAGADLSATSLIGVDSKHAADGKSLLILAANSGNPDLVALLLERGAIVNYTCNGKCDPALNSAIQGHGSRINALPPATTTAERNSLSDSYQAVISLLLEHGADANLSTGKFSATPLFNALADNGTDFIPYLIDHGANINEVSGRDGEWPITLAAKNGDAPAVRTLLAQGADTRAVNMMGKNALLAAIDSWRDSEVRLDIVQQLLAAGAPLNARDGGLTTTLIAALDQLRRSTFRHFAQSGENQGADMKIVLQLIELGVDLDNVDETGNSALEIARENKLVQVVQAIEQRIGPAAPLQTPTQPFIRKITSPAAQNAIAVAPTSYAAAPKRQLHVNQVIRAIAIAPDGRVAAIGGDDGRLRLQSLLADGDARELLGHTDAITTLAFSPDGKLLVSGGWDKTLRLWDVDRGKEIRRLVGHAWAVKAAVFHPDGRSVFSGAMDFTLRRWDVASGQMNMIYSNAGNDTRSIAVSADGSTLLAQDDRTGIGVWDIASARKKCVYRLPDSSQGAFFSPDGLSILADLGFDITAGNAGSYSHKRRGVIGLNIQSGQEPSYVVGNRTFLTFSADGKYFLTHGEKDEIGIHENASGKLLGTLSSDPPPTGVMKLLPDNRTLLSAEENGVLDLWDLSSLMPPVR